MRWVVGDAEDTGNINHDWQGGDYPGLWLASSMDPFSTARAAIRRISSKNTRGPSFFRHSKNGSCSFFGPFSPLLLVLLVAPLMAPAADSTSVPNNTIRLGRAM